MSIDEVERRKNGHGQSCKCDDCYQNDRKASEQPKANAETNARAAIYGLGHDAFRNDQPVGCAEAFNVWFKEYTKRWLLSENEPPDRLVASSAWQVAWHHKRESISQGCVHCNPAKYYAAVGDPRDSIASTEKQPFFTRTTPKGKSEIYSGEDES